MLKVCNHNANMGGKTKQTQRTKNNSRVSASHGFDNILIEMNFISVLAVVIYFKYLFLICSLRTVAEALNSLVLHYQHLSDSHL